MKQTAAAAATTTTTTTTTTTATTTTCLHDYYSPQCRRLCDCRRTQSRLSSRQSAVLVVTGHYADTQRCGMKSDRQTADCRRRYGTSSDGCAATPSHCRRHRPPTSSPAGRPERNRYVNSTTGNSWSSSASSEPEVDCWAASTVVAHYATSRRRGRHRKAARKPETSKYKMKIRYIKLPGSLHNLGLKWYKNIKNKNVKTRRLNWLRGSKHAGQ